MTDIDQLDDEFNPIDIIHYLSGDEVIIHDGDVENGIQFITIRGESFE